MLATMTDPNVSVVLTVSSSSPTTCVTSTAPKDAQQIALEVAAILKEMPSSSSNSLTSTMAETASGNLTPPENRLYGGFMPPIAT